jgi:DNA/RNA-binding domain of Phe-tRNA-synthetase-like protein
VADPVLEDGWVDPELAGEFPQLSITWCLLERGSGRTPREIKERLREMSNRYTGGKAVQLRQEPVPWAYRVFFRQVGLDPDEQRTAPEQAALDRMKWGGFRSTNLLDDAMLIATVETGVPLMALDADRLSTEPGLRLSRPGETLGPNRPLSDSQIIVADADKPLAILFGQIGEHAGVTPQTTRTLLVAVTVKGVPRVSIEEALWTAAELMEGGG